MNRAALRRAGGRRSLYARNETALAGLVLLGGGLAAIALPNFRSSVNLNSVLDEAAAVAVVAVGEAIVIVARQIDLSVGAILGLCAYVIGSVVGHLHGLASPLVGVGLALGLGGGLGLFNALLVERVRMPAIIATLATLSIYSGTQVLLANGSQIYLSQLPAWLASLEATSWAGVGSFIWFAAASLLVGSFLMRLTRFGRDLYAMGSNPEAAQYLGARSGLRLYQAFAVCGALAGIGGLMYAGEYGNIDATAGAGFELTVIAAAVIGGVSLFGGSGTPFGAVMGALLLTEIENMLALLKISIFAQQTLQGVAIVLAVALYAVVSRRLRRPMRRHVLAEAALGTPELTGKRDRRTRTAVGSSQVLG
jgi:rhamnose transport system permease protein